MDHGGGNCSKNNNHLSWDFWEVGSSRFDWNSFSAPSSSSSSLPTTATRTTTTRTTTATATATCSSDLTSLHFTNFSNHRPTTPSEMHPFHLHNPTLFKPQQNHHHNHHNQQDQEPTGIHFSSSSSSSSSSSFILPHSHFFSNNSSDSLTCLKLGKRQYFEDSSEPTTDQHVTGFSLGKKNRQASPMAFAAAAASVAVPRCQVEGCNVGLLNAKEYHKRHKVCEMHSKAPNVVVLGIEQRFCQQCSRFHVVSEFDDSKRSCRRRLAGHNERRRKNSSDSINRNHSQENKMGDRYQMPSIAPSAGRALSLLSSKAASWVSPSDLSSRSSDALRELIAENRAAILAKQLFSDRGLQALDDASMAYSHMQQQQQLPGFHFHEPLSHACSSISVRPTLDLMQTANSSYPMVPTRGKSKEEDDECEIWKSLEGTHIV